MRKICLAIFLMAALFLDVAHATTYSYLEITQGSYIGTGGAGSVVLPDSGVATDTLVDADDDYNPTTGAYYKYREFQSGDTAVSYNDFPVTTSPSAVVVGSGLSTSLGSGYASTAERILRGEAAVISNGAPFSESWVETEVRNSFTVLAGNSGLSEGDTTRIKLNVRLDGRLTATGTSWPGSGDAFSNMLANLWIKDPLVTVFNGEGYSVPKAVSFGAQAEIEAGSVYMPYWGESYASDWSGNWGATTNTGVNLSGNYSDYVESTATDVPVTTSYFFDTGMLSLEFDAIVGHTLDFYAFLEVWSSTYGIASAFSDFSSTFGPSIVDTNGTGVVIAWDLGEAGSMPIPAAVPEPSTLLLVGGGLIGLTWYGRRRKQG